MCVVCTCQVWMDQWRGYLLVSDLVIREFAVQEDTVLKGGKGCWTTQKFFLRFKFLSSMVLHGCTCCVRVNYVLYTCVCNMCVYVH